MHSWTVDKISLVENKGNAFIPTKESEAYIDELHATEQVLVDSDEETFVYILEDADNYVHVRFPSLLWSQLNLIREKNLPVYAVFICENDREITIELTRFLEELNYLLENIKGNSNYGNRMMSAVERFF